MELTTKVFIIAGKPKIDMDRGLLNLNDEDLKRAKRLIRTLEPYVNGKLITCVFEKYFQELKELLV